MSLEVELKTEASARGFEDIVWPAIREYCGGGHIEIVEGGLQGANFRDVIGGIDAWQVVGRGVRGIASRVQNVAPYASFTIRAERPSGKATEKDKRIFAVINRDEGMENPHWTIQAYLRGDSLLCVGAVKTNDLYRYLLNGGVYGFNHKDGTKFWIVWWRDLLESGVRMFRYVRPGIKPGIGLATHRLEIVEKEAFA